MTFGQALRLARRRRGMTQREAAAEIGVSQATVSDWEKGAMVPRNSEYIGPLAKLLDRSEDEVERALWITVVPTGHPKEQALPITPVKSNTRARIESLNTKLERLSEDDIAVIEAMADRLLGDES